ncbi:HAMP domain-containing sensor histidine kinase [uncultured Sphingomonas sp.]|uniref:sensor histidine kinase n=1 Tax=uncultured Sphingomonas sp. TaxID=158754 RepID=UPI0025E0DA59|nr:HAMP domain-containing sensor histidine kinase [uncultured Sphingomonas sp.]
MLTPERRRALATLASGVTLTLGGAAALAVWRAGMWGSLLGTAMAVAWLLALGCWMALRRAPAPAPSQPARDAWPITALLDQVPVPLLRIEGVQVRAINRAARALFVADDRIPAPPSTLTDPATRHLRHAGRRWRIDAVALGDAHRLAALIDVDAEEHAAQERAQDEMIDILGHELLNGLSPIVSLADSAVTAAQQGDAMLGDILATLARRVEGLEGFARAYRQLARLPDPVAAPVTLTILADDLARLFRGRFGTGVTLAIEASGTATIDRDQMAQALWALLQNGAEAALAAAAPARVALALHSDGTFTAEVRDSGPGIAAADRARIFRAFHTDKPGGSGIGLTLARRIARAHGGELMLLDSGETAFRLTVPA